MRNLKQLVQITCLVTTVVTSPLSGVALAQDSGNVKAHMPQPSEGNAKPDKLVMQRTRLNDEVLKLSQPLTCKADTDCASLAMGAKPCGGPWKFVLYSKKNAKVPALKKKIDEYNKLDQQLNAQTQTMSDCSVTLEPEPKCVNKMCVDSANVNAADAKAGFQNVKPVTH